MTWVCVDCFALSNPKDLKCFAKQWLCSIDGKMEWLLLMQTKQKPDAFAGDANTNVFATSPAF